MKQKMRDRFLQVWLPVSCSCNNCQQVVQASSLLPSRVTKGQWCSAASLLECNGSCHHIIYRPTTRETVSAVALQLGGTIYFYHMFKKILFISARRTNLSKCSRILTPFIFCRVMNVSVWWVCNLVLVHLWLKHKIQSKEFSLQHTMKPIVNEKVEKQRWLCAAGWCTNGSA